MITITVGASHEVDCPFVRQRFDWFDEDGQCSTLSWKPGIEWEDVGETAEPRAHGWGKVQYRVVAVVSLPAPYLARVFFTRKWVSPDGKPFGSKALRITTLSAFRRRLRSYRPAGVEDYHTLIVSDLDDEAKAALLGKAVA